MAALLRTKLPSLPSLLRQLRPFSALPEPDPLTLNPKPASPEPKPLNPLLQLQLSIRSEPDPDRIAALFLSSKTLHRFHSSRPLFSLTVRRLTRAQRPDLVKRVLDPCLTDESSPKSEGFLARIISLYSSAGLPDEAMEAFFSACGYPRSELAFSALLQAFVRNGRYKDLKSVVERVLEEFKLRPGVISHNILINGLCESGEIYEARKLLDEMSKGENGRPEPSIVSYNTLLCAYLKRDMDGPFDEILKEINEKGLEPNVVTYNCRIARFCNKGESFMAEELLDLMDLKEIKPSISTFYNLIHGYCKQGDVSSGVRMYKRMKVMKRRSGSDGVSPNSDIYNILITSLIENERIDDALWICIESLRRKSVPPFEEVKRIINGLLRESKFDEAKALNERMKVVLIGEPKDMWEEMIGHVSFEPIEVRV